MIKIDLDQKTKAKIVKIHLEDAHTAPTGLFRVLGDSSVQSKLKSEFPKIYGILYDALTGQPAEEEVKKLLLADRKGLKDYISKLGSYDADKTKYLLENVFQYERYARRKGVCMILDEMHVTVCPYCNRQYIFTVAGGKVRPQLDHYYPKKMYPYLALSLYNMIPSCSICNMAKASLNTLDTPVLYPYDEEFGYDARFEIQIRKKDQFVQVMEGVSREFAICLDADNANRKKEIDTQMEKLHLTELYDKHTDYVMDILKSKHIYTQERIREIRNQFPQLFRSEDEVRNMLYMTDIRKESWRKRPLSKLTHDIDEQVERGHVKMRY